MTFKEKYGNTALVAGASEGMGAAYAYSLAAKGLDLVLIARRTEPLEETSRRITEQFCVNVQHVVCDLASPDVTEQIIQALGNRSIDFLVYNAALSYIGPYLATPLSTHTNIATVNMLTPLSLLHYIGTDSTAQKHFLYPIKKGTSHINLTLIRVQLGLGQRFCNGAAIGKTYGT